MSGLSFFIIFFFILSPLELHTRVHHRPFTQLIHTDYSDASQMKLAVAVNEGGKKKGVRRRDVTEHPGLISALVPRNHVLFTKLFSRHVGAL